jgi:hypothetical protein
VQKQSAGLRRELADEVWFVTDGLREHSSVTECCLKALALCSNAHSREAMKKV